MKRTKICFVLFGAYPLFNPECSYRHGGSEVRLYLLAEALAKDEHFEVSFIVGDFGQNPLETYNEINVYSGIDIRKGKNVSYLVQIPRLFRVMKRVDADVYIRACAGPMAGIVAFFCKIYKKKFMYMIAHWMDVDNTYITKNKIKGLLYKYALFNSDLIIAQNLEQQYLLQENHHLRSIVVKNPVILNGVDQQKVAKKYILWVASSQQFKQPELFLELARRFPRERFLMIMPRNDPGVFSVIKNQAEQINNLVLVEHIPYHKINRVYQRAKLFVNTSTYEGFPNTFLQAAIHKTPIVSLNVNPDNFITQHNCGCFAKGDFSLMIKQIQELISDEEKTRQMGNNAVEYVKQQHDLKVIIEQFKTALYQVMDSPLCVE
jgi:glycosyltransferase involved in cell wall biosynthesis